MTYTVTEKKGKDLKMGDIYWEAGKQGWTKIVTTELKEFLNKHDYDAKSTFLVQVPSPKGAEEAFEEFVKEKGIILSEEEKESSFEFFLGGFRSSTPTNL